jgi:MerR family redox-sensitive transcriptional activator SoxR
MPQLSISEAAREVGLRPSTIRYYEQIGILPPIQRTSGQRRYDTTSLHRLAVIQRARRTGFTLDEIRELFFGFASGTRAPARWQELSQRKLVELEASIDRIKTMQRLLVRLQNRCRCDTLDECGKRLLKRRITNVRAKFPRARPSSTAIEKYGM